MTRQFLRIPHALRAVLVFVLAAALMVLAAHGLALVMEARAERLVGSRLEAAGMNWVTVESDGLQVHLTGTAPNESARFRALNLVGSLVGASLIHDRLEVSPTTALTAPRFSVEMLRNDDGVQVIGLIPELPDEDGLSHEALIEAVNSVTAGDPPADMVQTAAWPAPQGWDEALRYGIDTLNVLKRAKISVSAGRVEIIANAVSELEKRELEAELRRRKPPEVTLRLDLTAPLPVITPFTLRFIKDEAGMRFDACSADTPRARNTILRAASQLGMQGTTRCTVGLGSPSPRWAEGAVSAITAVAALPAGAVTISDANITFTAGEGTSPEAFDRALGELRAALPSVFSLEAVQPRPAESAQGPVQFTATRRDGGRVELRGRLLDEGQQAVIDAFARAQFGAENIYVATRLDPELPEGWPIRVMAGLQSLAQLHDGQLVVQPDTVVLTGITGSLDARATITRILSSRLGQGQQFSVNVRYDKALDPLAGLPTPEECARDVNAILAKTKITFNPGSAEITRETRPVIKSIAEVLLKCPGIQMEVGGHTDSQGSDTGNQRLSQNRAEAVIRALLDQRVDTSGLTPVGYGESRPIADNASEIGRETNRRIEFTLLKGSEPSGEDATAEAGSSETPSSAALAAPGNGPQSEAEAASEGPDFSQDSSPSVAPTKKTIRPRPRPERQP